MDLGLQRELEQFIYAEASLLDARRFEDWLKLLTDDVVYWVPNFTEDGAPGDYGVIVREDLAGLRARVARIGHRQNPTQKPASRTLHILTNVIIVAGDDETVEVAANFLLYVSKDGCLNNYPGKVEYRLRRYGSSWRIGLKKIYLIANDMALNQLPLM